VDSKAECVRLNLAHVARKDFKTEETKPKQTDASAHLVKYRFKIREASAEGRCYIASDQKSPPTEQCMTAAM